MVVASGTQGYDLLTTGRSRLLAELPISLQFQTGAKHSAIAFAHASEAGKLDALPRLERRFNIPLDFTAEEGVHACHCLTATPSVIAAAWPPSRALGGGSAGRGPVHDDGGNHVQDPSSKAQR